MTRSEAPLQPEPPDDTPLALLRPHWRLVLAAFLGWFLDAFDQLALLLVLPDIGKSFGVSLTAMGFVITAQSFGRIAGNIGWGWLADRFGRKLAFMAGVVWFAACSGLTGLAWSYGALLVIQMLFGIGFGGEWTASAALLMESVPAKARAVASSLMMSGYEVGFFAASGIQALILPQFGWRSLFFIGIVPALLAIFIRMGLKESPVWLRTQAARGETQAARSETRAARSGPPASRGDSETEEPSPRPRFQMTPAAWQACAFMAMLQFQTASLYSFYPTLLKTGRGFGPDNVFAAVAAYSLGSILGKLACGRVAARFGHRPVILTCLVVTVLGIFPFALASTTSLAMVTAFVVGGSSSGVFALVPHYLSLRFANTIRSFGMGLAYAIAAFSQGIATYALPATGLALPKAIGIFVIASSLAVAAVVVREPHDLPGREMDAV